MVRAATPDPEEEDPRREPPRRMSEGEFKKALVGVDFGQLSALIEQSQQQGGSPPSIREQTYADTARILFDDDKLLKTANLRRDFAFYMMKMLILRGFYYDCWRGVTLTFKAVSVKTPPYFRMSYQIRYAGLTRKQWQDQVYDRFINEVLSLTLSTDGLARGQAVEIMKATDRLLREEELKKMGSMMYGMDLRPKGPGGG